MGYDSTKRNLEIEFRSGLVYQYSGVPEKIHADMMASSVIGKFYSETIRNRYRSTQLAVKS